MRYREAVEAMIEFWGYESLYTNDQRQWTGDDLLDATAEVEIDHEPEEADYSFGVHGNRPGVYRLRGGAIEGNPVVEPVSKSSKGTTR